MTFYPELGVSDNDVAGAVVLEAIHDMKVNNFAFSGFPAIWAQPLQGGVSTIFISERSNSDKCVSFQIPEKEAIAAARSFQKGERVGGKLFEAVQAKLAELERVCS